MWILELAGGIWLVAVVGAFLNELFTNATDFSPRRYHRD